MRGGISGGIQPETNQNHFLHVTDQSTHETHTVHQGRGAEIVRLEHALATADAHKTQ